LSYRIAAIVAVLALFPPFAPALEGQYPIQRVSFEELVTLASPGEDRLRVDQILGRAPHAGFLSRSASSLSFGGAADTTLAEVAILAPELRWIHNSGLPYTFNDGAFWAGRGHNFQAIMGVRARVGPVSLILAPEVGRSENREYQILPYLPSQDPPRSIYASPFYDWHESIDVPTRFGGRSIAQLGLGQSSLSIAAGPVTAGVATENLWWGPGLRNAIVLSSHAEGIPHFFLRTSRPIATRIGTFDGRWIAGRLTESRYFDADASNDERAIGGITVSYAPAAEPDLTIGLARTVYSEASRGAIPITAAFDVFRSVGRPNSRNRYAALEYDADQVSSLFARWVFPGHGLESWFEWARFEEPASLRDLFVAPNHSQGYTVGLQWARETGIPADFRLYAEISYLEPSTTYKERPVFSAYTSRAVEQGYTQRGQVLGASIGPGASSQWLAADLLGGRWRAGAFAGRIRWNEGALVREDPPSILSHEISVIAGVRAGVTVAGLRLHSELAREGRLNYMFQNPIIGLDDPEGVDIRNLSLRFSVQPAVGPRRAPPPAPAGSAPPSDPR
jgi:hypothetical protein